jgi:hypothetical protein
MAKEYENATELNEPKIVVRTPLPPSDQTTKVLQPSEEPFHLPAAAITAHGSTVLCEVDPIRSMWSNHLNVSLRGQPRIQPIAVIRGVPDQSVRDALG